MTNKPELLSPAGDMEKLKMAVCYGADAVYLAGTSFGMRASAGNFDADGLKTAIEYCHGHNVKVYVTCNTLPREYELGALPEYLRYLNGIKADALIVADMGVVALARKYAPDTALHISTQLGVVNSESANFLHSLGADTVVLARELSLNEIVQLRKNTDPGLKIECFVHGAMCVSFSGRCLISNYLTDRDANRGQCAQPCRWKYHLIEESRPGVMLDITEDKGTYLYNSRDLNMISHIGELIEAGVDSFKIEGRMKSSYYTAAVTNAYRHVIDDILAGREPDTVWIKETDKVSHRDYSTGFFYGYPGQYYDDAHYFTDSDVVAVVEECDSDGNAVCVQRNKFFSGDRLELLSPKGYPAEFTAEAIYDLNGTLLEDTRHAAMKFRIRLPRYAQPLSILRKNR